MEDRRARAPAARPGQPPYGHSERRARPRLTDQIQVIRELWLLREQARVQAAERCFLTELERLLSGRPYYQTSDQQTPSPPRPPHGMPNIGVVSPTAPAPPPLPPFPPASPPVMSAVTFLDDGLVFESHPPPRGDHAPVRERPGSVSQEMEQARASQLVTNLSPEFRARLEGNGPPDEVETLTRSRSFGQLSDQRTVSSVLDSQFRHRLEGLLHRRGANAHQMQHLYRTASFGTGDLSAASDVPEESFRRQHHSSGTGDPLEAIVTALREEVNVLRNVVNASFDLQLDIQRSIRQEVAAAMNTPATLSWNRGVEDTSACSTEASSSMTVGQPNPNVTSIRQAPTGPIKAGTCTICLENNVDALLYGCGHMCTCSACGRQLLIGGLVCPLCRAPVRDVVRAYVVAE